MQRRDHSRIASLTSLQFGAHTAAFSDSVLKKKRMTAMIIWQDNANREVSIYHMHNPYVPISIGGYNEQLCIWKQYHILFAWSVRFVVDSKAVIGH